MIARKKTTKVRICVRCKEPITPKRIDPDVERVIIPAMCDPCFEKHRAAGYRKK